MKKKFIIIGIIIFIVLLIPYPIKLKDGGTVEYHAVLYCVTNRNSLWTNIKGTQGFLPDVQEGAEGNLKGIEIKIVGIKVFSNVKFVERPQ